MRDNDGREVAFFGKITAGFTHEMKNILAIIRESSGLIEDLMAIAPETSAYHDKYKKSLERINDQVNRGVELSTRLNKFAHSMDFKTTLTNPYEITEQLIGLAQRFARLKNVVLKTNPSLQAEQSVQLPTNPVQLQMALFTAIECWLSLASPDNQITIYPAKKEEFVLFVMECEGDFPAKENLAHGFSTTEKWSFLQIVITGLGGHIKIEDTPPRLLIFFQGQNNGYGLKNG